MKILKGTKLVPGIAEGIVALYVSEIEKLLPHYSIKSSQIPVELDRLDASLRRARETIEPMIGVSHKEFRKEASEIFSVHLSILRDQKLLNDISSLIRTKRINVEHAIHDVFEDYIRGYQTKEGHFNELINDLIDIRNRLLETFNIPTGGFQSFIGESQPIIVATRYLTPSMVLKIQRRNVLAFILEEAGITSHAIILARSYGVPIVFGIEVEKELQCGMEAIVEGYKGEVIINAGKKEKEYYHRKMQRIRMRRELCEVAGTQPLYMKDRQRITMKVNVSTPDEFNAISDLDHDGVGLLRTEFLFMRGGNLPSEEEQYEIYSKLLKQTAGKQVTIRLLDMAMDKMPPYLEIPQDRKQADVVRGALAVEMFPDIYLTQVKALLRADCRGCNYNMRLLYPMVSDPNDVRTFRDVVEEAKKSLKLEGVERDFKNIKEGIMIETPAAVMMAEELLKEVDFANIGSNDLLQYTLATSRGSPKVEKRYHIFHPAIAKMLRFVAETGKELNKEVCLCGEIASFEEFYPLLLKLGLRSFSVAVSRFADIKCELLYELQNLHESSEIDMVKNFYGAKSKEEIDSFFRKFV
ncbi:phosphoenolpyruvate--protein phosphotransferase [bacterium]|nr:phosphoenolpyruvate--protein phosphotransferase [bacterium]